MSDFKIDNIEPATVEMLSSGTFIVVLNAGSVPPHLELLSNGKIFAWEAKRVRINHPLRNLLESISRKKIPALFIKLQLNRDPVPDLSAIIKGFDSTPFPDKTCLGPLKIFSQMAFDMDTKRINFIFELLPELNKLGKIESTCHLFLDEQMEGGSFTFPVYTMNDVQSRIRTLTS